MNRLTGGFSGWKFEAYKQNEYTGSFKNPERGWYQVHNFSIEEEIDTNSLEWCLDKNDALALLLIDIGGCKNRDLSDIELERIRNLLRFFSSRGYDIILRAAYDHKGKAFEREPSSFEQVVRHMEQIGGIVREFDREIFIYQGLLLGSWGEMHSSRFLSRERLLKLSETLSKRKGKRTFLAVRKPAQWRMLHKREDLTAQGAGDKMGLFDDGILGSSSNLGTFGDKPEKEAGWMEAWARADELGFEDKLCGSVPNGGEAVFQKGYTDALSVKETLNTLFAMHISYLNRTHDERLLEQWKNTRLETGEWKGKSLYEYIGAHMGYRFLIKKVKVSFGADLCRVEAEIENRGFASLYDEAGLLLKLGGQTVELPCDMRGWKSGGAYKVLCEIEPCEGELYLFAKRRSDGAPIRFANASNDDGEVLLGRIKRTR